MVIIWYIYEQKNISTRPRLSDFLFVTKKRNYPSSGWSLPNLTTHIPSVLHNNRSQNAMTHIKGRYFQNLFCFYSYILLLHHKEQ